MARDATVAVVGAGLGGLVTAARLAEDGYDVRVFERADEVGGRVRTRREGGYVLDRGFQVLFTAYPAVRRELDLDALDLRRFAPGAWLARGGQRSLLADPFRDPGALVESLFNTEVTLGDKVRTVGLRRDLRRRGVGRMFDGEDVTIERYLADRGFSRRFGDRFAAPFYGGITLDRSLSTSSHVFEFTFKMLSAGDIAVPARGMAAIPEQLAERALAAGASIETGTPVTSVEGDDDGATVVVSDGTLEADVAVVAAGPAGAAELTGVDAVPTETNGCVTQYYALPNSASLDAGGRLVLNVTDDNPNHLVPHSEVAPEHAPDDVTLVSATFLGTPGVDDGALADRTRETLRRWYPERRFDDVEVVHTVRIPEAQFAQPPGFRATLPSTRDPAGRVYLAGDITRWSSIQGAMESGRTAARAVDADLR